jgi:hypothetical protein
MTDLTNETLLRLKGKNRFIQGISRAIVSPVEMQMQPTIHFQSKRGYFKYRIVLK